jgi:glycosyltransferase involved in cell wall biosynthesis
MPKQGHSTENTDMSDKPSICIVSHNAYGTFSRKGGHIGGVEWQTSLLARWLANKGYRISLLTWDEGGGDDEMIDGVRVIKICPKNKGLPIVRFIYPRWTGLIRALRIADSDIYYHNCAECVTGQIALWCSSHHRSFIFSAANDMDCDAALPDLHTWREKMLYRYGIKAADGIIVQTHTQQVRMLETLGRNSVVIPMPCKEPNNTDQVVRERPVSSRILWIGRICPFKRPGLLLELARANPDMSIDLVGPGGLDAFSLNIMKEAQGLGNVRIHGAVSRERAYEFYRNALCLLCTSEREGFPNTFLEAWSCGLPIISTFDPDQVIAQEKLGIVAQDAKGLAFGIRRLMAQEDYYARCSENAVTYFYANHAAEASLPRFEREFLKLYKE